MKYTNKQIEEYIDNYIISNKNEIKERLKFLLNNWKEQDLLLPSDVWYCFEESRHAYMMGDFVASIILSAVTIERYLAYLLGLPYYSPKDEKVSLEGVGTKIIETAKDRNIIDDNFAKKLFKLNTMRNDFVHGIDSKEHRRPQKNIFMWLSPEHHKEIEDNARKAILILFEAMEMLHYTKVSF